MNCKPGDMAVVIQSRTGKIVGNVVTCIRLLDLSTISQKTISIWGPIWMIDREFPWTIHGVHGQPRPWIPDRWLLPINPLDDEQIDTAEPLAVES